MFENIFYQLKMYYSLLYRLSVSSTFQKGHGIKKITTCMQFNFKKSDGNLSIILTVDINTVQYAKILTYLVRRFLFYSINFQSSDTLGNY